MVNFAKSASVGEGNSRIVRVNLAERSYDISIGVGQLHSVGALLTKCRNARHAVVITDSNVESPHAETVIESLLDSGIDVGLVVTPPGEDTKSVDFAEQLWQNLLQMKADRTTVVVAVGGGVIGDLAGFVAATFARGLDFFQVPTTLLAQVDSSVGGKVGINLPNAKNMVGCFWQPLGVAADPLVFDTLPAREYASALAEVVKYGMILDAEFLAYLEEHAAEILARESHVLLNIVARCCELKASVVEADEREISGLRAVLNYGHTFGHAFEAVAGYGTLLHGEAVAIGMMCASRLAARLGRIEQSLVARQQALLETLGLPVTPPTLDSNSLISSMLHDKKTTNGKLRFVLPDRVGHVELVGDISEEDVRLSLCTD